MTTKFAGGRRLLAAIRQALADGGISSRGLAISLFLLPVILAAAGSTPHMSTRMSVAPPVLPGLQVEGGAGGSSDDRHDAGWAGLLPPVDCGFLTPTVSPDTTARDLFPRRAPHIAQVTLFRVLATAYSSTAEETDDTPELTATNATTRRGIIALSRDLLREFTPGAPFSFGDRVEIPGVGKFVVEDTMSPRYRHRVDIWCPTREEAMEWGRRRVHLRPAQARETFGGPAGERPAVAPAPPAGDRADAPEVRKAPEVAPEPVPDMTLTPSRS